MNIKRLLRNLCQYVLVSFVLKFVGISFWRFPTLFDTANSLSPSEASVFVCLRCASRYFDALKERTRGRLIYYSGKDKLVSVN